MPAATIGEVAEMATKDLELQDKERCLNFDGERLDAARSLAEYKIEDQCELQLILVPVNSSGGNISSCGTKPSKAGYSSTAAAAAKVEPKGQDSIRAYGQQGSLYARCGGIFGIAGFVDRCMDVWMSDPTLNANDAVATWHGRAQRCGFKFLVTQLMGYLCGGPQVYTGRDMAASHKHLNIDSDQWASFMECLQEVCMEFQLPQQDIDDLTAVILSMMDDCIVTDGEVVPPNPGHLAPPGNSLYAQMGGVYPIALFADRLIDAMLEDERVNISTDGVKRSAASIKYLFTEVVCNICGGPEVITAPDLEDARLNLSSKEFFFFLLALDEAADHVNDAHVRMNLKQCVYDKMDVFLDPKRTVAWDSVCHISKDPKIKTYRQMKEAIDNFTQRLGCPRMLYIPGKGVTKMQFNAKGEPATEDQNNALRDKMVQLGFGGPARKSSVKSSDAASKGGGDRGA
eukprot:gnl/MRDRNA2_/MRDRNA2_171635_c0_seq1.p1 gnl/MRDRNA2_/MRDRNA2_171635_c0~~gnl/MRDRNA2_/MRDRNA2_171635_c0_seq1.p1  ORF type:complete len:465 (+),score=100.38 gnl/MRDRNA2_/MRDRNA2_171635_c0_seq1:25-1395(+)